MHGLPARLAGDLLEAADFLRAFGEALQLTRLSAAELAQALSSQPPSALRRKLNLLQVQLLRLLLADPSAARWQASGSKVAPPLRVHATPPARLATEGLGYAACPPPERSLGCPGAAGGAVQPVSGRLEAEEPALSN